MAFLTLKVKKVLIFLLNIHLFSIMNAFFLLNKVDSVQMIIIKYLFYCFCSFHQKGK